MASFQRLLSSSLSHNLPKKMSASALLLFSTSCTTSLIRPRKHLFLPFSSKPFSAPSLRFRPYTSSAAALDTLNTETAAVDPLDSHPWTEWVTFIDRLKSKGYFVESNNITPSDYKDMNFVKDACTSFARDRFDLLKLLSTDDIETVVGSGCPNLLRKAVNSSKRLRAYVQLDEGDVCGTCNLRDSCDRAYSLLKESEGAARTVDIVRILLSYALDPLVISEGEKPPGRERIDASARNLLSDLTKLSDTKVSGNRDEEFNNVEMKRGDWMCSKCNFLNFSKNVQCRKCKEDGPINVRADISEMKEGDWICSECTFMNFARNTRCLKCKEGPPNKVGSDDAQMKKAPPRTEKTVSGNNRDDWTCPKCNFLNFSKNVQCRKCKEDCPKNVRADVSEMKAGDWICSECTFMNFARNTRCLKCKAGAPKKVGSDDAQMKKGPPRTKTTVSGNRDEEFNNVEMRRGDWMCPKCNFLNFSKNVQCRKCKEDGPKNVRDDKSKLKTGDWICSECTFTNFARNTRCLKCKAGAPKKVGSDDAQRRKGVRTVQGIY